MLKRGLCHCICHGVIPVIASEIQMTRLLLSLKSGGESIGRRYRQYSYECAGYPRGSLWMAVPRSAHGVPILQIIFELIYSKPNRPTAGTCMM